MGAAHGAAHAETPRLYVQAQMLTGGRWWAKASAPAASLDYRRATAYKYEGGRETRGRGVKMVGMLGQSALIG